jgi:hypothetical protein
VKSEVVKRFPSEPFQSCLLYILMRATGVQERLWRFYTKSWRIYRKVWRFSQVVDPAYIGVEILHKLCKVYLMLEENSMSVHGGTRIFTSRLQTFSMGLRSGEEGGWISELIFKFVLASLASLQLWQGAPLLPP